MRPVGKDYEQYCPLAHALGVVGERWTLLVVRELLHGPKRYTDLAEGLPGIGTYALARWGARSLGPPTPEDELYPEWGVNALPALFNAEAARGLTETYVFAVGPDTFTARIENGHLHACVEAAKNADLRVETDMDTFFGLASGDLSPRDAVATGRAKIQGDPAVLERCFDVLSLAPRQAPAAA